MTQPAAFGLNVDPNAGGLAIAGRIAAIADSAGLEYVGIQDHPYNAEFLDTFTVITWQAPGIVLCRSSPSWSASLCLPGVS